MPDLKDSVILILSPQAWGTMFVSKHHYALELARRGNKVFYLNPPHKSNSIGKGRITVASTDLHPDLYLIDHTLFFPYNLKFHAPAIFQWLMQFQIRRILKAVRIPVDVVWSFDLGNLYPFMYFDKNAYKIFHPVDEPLNKQAIKSGKGSDVIFSVTREILQKYSVYTVPKHFINHGVSDLFFQQDKSSKSGKKIQVGFSGNLLRSDIDRQILLHIIKSNSACEFHFWGSYTSVQANIGGNNDVATEDFVGQLKNLGNVLLHGAVSTEKLASAMQHMDLFLICYDIHKDQSKGTNYHKIIEFLTTGKVIVANNITTYADRPDLIQMVAGRKDNSELPKLFEQVVGNLASLNDEKLSTIRIDFAKQNTYRRQLECIELKISGDRV